MSDDKKFTYPGGQVDVQWDGRLCIHIAECGRSEGELFLSGRQPWCQPDLVAVDQVVEVVERCPTGALSYSVKQQGHQESPDRENTVIVSCNGPYFIRGELDIEDAPDDMTGIAFRAAMCQAASPVKTLDELRVEEHPYPGGQEFRFHVRARSFLHNQVRAMIGTLKLVGEGKWTAADVAAALAARDRSAGGPTAPACGLYFLGADYEKSDEV